ncbi:sensor histidine kinase [Actinomadura kijaniata]|uniref:sensor histidine kinase n=1 Tax=Actinomadura kijaniata TaxID=46161 RepID=UPI000A6B72AA|nr:sensor histidine kinase [Actinomadura kijaniata]
MPLWSVLSRTMRGGRADAALALGLFALSATYVLLFLEGRSWQSAYERVPGSGWTLTVIACGALYWRRRRPVTVAVVVGLACAAYYPMTEPDGPILLAFIVALYTVAAEGRTAAAALFGAAALGVMAYGEVTSGINHLRNSGLYLMAGWFVAVVAVGGVAHNRRAYLREYERRLAEAVRTREEEARRRATEERLRIARDLHDVLGHNISLINVQAAAALHGLRRDPSRAESALTAIKATSKDTLRELRATLGVLRQVDEDAPAAGLARLAELTSGASAAGLTVRAVTEGAARPVPAEVDLAAYRIVQESLTNVTRHSAATEATVRVRYAGDAVRVEIDDPGPPRDGASPGSGNGVRGMRERAEALGGELSAGPGPGGGFRVSARLPLS